MTNEYAEEARMDMSALVWAIVRRLPRIIIITMLFLGITYFYLSTVPPQFQSTASILIEPRDNVFTRATNDLRPNSLGVDPSIISSHVELIKSRDNLIRVIEKEGLRDIAEFNGSSPSPIGSLNSIFSLLSGSSQKQSPDQRILLELDKRLKVIQMRDSRVIGIFVRAQDPVLAAKIANSIANMHVMLRSELTFSDTRNAVSWLASEVETMRLSVASAEAAVAKYRIDNDLFVGSNNTSLLDQQLTIIATQISQAQERSTRAQSRVDQIDNIIKQGGSLESVPDVRDSIVVQRLSQDKARLQGERAQLLATLLPNHPNIQAKSAQIAEIDKHITAEALQVAQGLKGEAQIQANLEKSLRDDLVRLKIDVSGATKNSVMLNELEREATAQRDLLATYLLRYRDASARTNTTSAVPDVRVVSAAAPAIKPASPKKLLLLMAVAIVSISLQIGQVLIAELLSGRAIRGGNINNAGMNSRDNKYYSPSLSSEHKEDQSNTMPLANNDSSYERAEVNSKKPDIRLKNLVQDIDSLSAQIANSKQQIVLVLSLGGSAMETVKSISSTVITKDGSVVEIDAGSNSKSYRAGLSDLCEGGVEFSDVIHRQANSNFAIVPWGRNSTINFYSQKCKTLVSALGEIFETVIIDVGKAGVASSLPAFASSNAMVLIVVGDEANYSEIINLKNDIHSLGMDNIQVVTNLSSVEKVA